MAMDKEKLLSYFQAHYLSRQEVLFKLPLNISIDSFWPELLNRRKARAQLLPLYNASGMLYWYVLTDRMSATQIKGKLTNLIKEQSASPWLFLKTPTKDFTRNRKISFSDTLSLLLSMEGRSTTHELLCYYRLLF